MKYIVWFLISGQVLGTRSEDENGQPWTKRKANAFCRRENEKAKAAKRGHEYLVRTVKD